MAVCAKCCGKTVCCYLCGSLRPFSGELIVVADGKMFTLANWRLSHVSVIAAGELYHQVGLHCAPILTRQTTAGHSPHYLNSHAPTRRWNRRRQLS
jgi:hypothetical protein